MRTKETLPVDEWEVCVSQLDGDVQEALAEYLAQWEPGPFVEYSADRLGRIDSESSPRYVDEDHSPPCDYPCEEFNLWS